MADYIAYLYKEYYSIIYFVGMGLLRFLEEIEDTKKTFRN